MFGRTGATGAIISLPGDHSCQFRRTVRQFCRSCYYKYHPSTVHTCLSVQACGGAWSLSPLVTGREAGSTLDRSPVGKKFFSHFLLFFFKLPHFRSSKKF
ncbi:hypothetical protein XENORESO_017091 [Xenotaenia resolanae]|uniref:Uncharacterized protein n=1 Tax=Xenotaenia resolanae TaxID=208358 RepID=A0ABV0VTY6_9TELE